MSLTTGLTTQVAIESSSLRKGLVALMVSTLETQAKVNYKAKVNALRELRSASGEELRPYFGRTLMLSHKGMISVLDKSFTREL